MAVAATETGDVYSAGTANILDMPEFYDFDLTKAVLLLTDQFEVLKNIFFRPTVSEEAVRVILGDELEYEYLSPCGFVYTPFAAGRSHEGVIGVVGPSRLNYPVVVPSVRYIGELISEISKNW